MAFGLPVVPACKSSASSITPKLLRLWGGPDSFCQRPSGLG
jgi:hypothetical protein